MYNTNTDNCDRFWSNGLIVGHSGGQDSYIMWNKIARNSPFASAVPM